jgi:aldehyde:ferredoxin oxidoreductase
VKNWAGAGTVDFPAGAVNFEDDTIIQWQTKKYGCWRCTIACGGYMSTKDGDAPYLGVKTHKVEYETAAAFGAMMLDDNVGALIKENEVCNEYGLDTISAGCTLAFAVECYERGIITREDTGGVELTWGNHQEHVRMLELMARREGFGDVLADGSKRAAERIGRGAEAYAMQVGGQGVPMHDPRFEPGLATTYKMDATPARHTQGGAYWYPPGREWPEELPKYRYAGKGALHKWGSDWLHVVNAAGLCMFANSSYPYTFASDFLTAVTGHPYTVEECDKAGERIANIRLAFCIREGDPPMQRAVPGRIVGDPPLAEGNVRGVTVDLDQMVRDYCVAMGWDPQTGVPSAGKLRELGLEFVEPDLRPLRAAELVTR